MSFLNENGLSYYDSKIKQNASAKVGNHNASSEAHEDIRDLLGIALHNTKVTSWADIQKIVREGFAKKAFNIGDQFTCMRGTDELVWDLIGIDQDVPTTSTATISGTGITAVDVDYITFLGKTEEAGEFVFEYRQRHEHSLTYVWFNGNTEVNLADYGIITTGTAAEGDTIKISIPHSVTLQLHNLWGTLLACDSPEAAFYIDEDIYPNGLVAGTYNFTWNYATGSMVNGTYQFTLTEDVPVGGQIVIDTNASSTALTSCKIRTYATLGSTTTIESDIVIASGSEGTSLGTITSTGVTSSINCAQRIMSGSNNWKLSGIRQWLNTDSAANAWWEAKNVFDRPTNADKAGFLRNMDAAFLDIIGEVTKTTQKSVSDGYGLETTTEKFFLLSRPEVYAGTERSQDGADGVPYSYYKDYSDLSEAGSGADSNRIKYRGSSAHHWWLRTPYSGNGATVHFVIPSGALNGTGASGSYGVAPACVIY